MMRLALPVAVFLALTVVEALTVVFVDTSIEPIDRTGGPFQVRDVAVGSVFTQRFEVRANGLNEVRLKGGMSAGGRPAVLRAQLLETDPQGATVRVVRTGRVEVAADETACCAFRFESVGASRWRRYRLDLTVEELGGRQLSLWLAPAGSDDSLTINARPRSAFLVFRTFATAGTGVGRLGTAPGRRPLLVLLVLIYNAGVAGALSFLATAWNPRRA